MRARAWVAGFVGIMGCLLAFSLGAPRWGWAHCDTMDGPVVKEAVLALKAGDVTPVLKWVRAEDEAAVKAAFQQTMEGGPIAVMLQEHERGRQRVKAMAAPLPQARAGDRQAQEALAVNLCAYIEHLQAHIDKENNVLFSMADQLLTAQEQQSLVQAFEKHEAEEMGEGVHEKYHQLAHELAST